MKKKLVAILLTAAMTLSLAACGGGGDTASNAPADDAAASTEEAAADDAAAADTDDAATEEAAAEIDPNDPWAGWADIDTSEPVVINYLCVSDKPTNPDTDEMMEVLNGILQEKVNATLQLNYVGWTDYLANYNLLLASMDGSVDLVVTADDWLDAWQNVDRGAFMEIPDEMIQTYAPATWQQVDEFGDWDMCRYTDGNIYLIPEDNYKQWTNHGFIYRLDWAREAGLEDGVHSWDDMTTYFQYCLDTFPDMIPWDVNGGSSVSECTGGFLASAGAETYPLIGISAGVVGYADNQVKCQYLEETGSAEERSQLFGILAWAAGVWGTCLGTGLLTERTGKCMRLLQNYSENLTVWENIRRVERRSQEEMAGIFDINIKRYRKIEKGYSMPDAEILQTLYEKMQYSPLLVLDQKKYYLDELNRVWALLQPEWRRETERFVGQARKLIRLSEENKKEMDAKK